MTYFAKEEEQPKEKYLEEKVANLKDQLVIALDRIEDLQAQQKRNNRIVSNLKELLVYKEPFSEGILRSLWTVNFSSAPKTEELASITFPDGTVRTIYKNEEHEEVKTKKPVRKVVKPVKKGKRK
jgi:hypothetical protein